MTEEPEREIPVARQIVKRYENRSSSTYKSEDKLLEWDTSEFKRRKTVAVDNIGGAHQPVVIQSAPEILNNSALKQFGFREVGERWLPRNIHADYLYCAVDGGADTWPEDLGLIIKPERFATVCTKNAAATVLLTMQEYRSVEIPNDAVIFLQITPDEIPACIEEIPAEAILVLSSQEQYPLHRLRSAILELIHHNSRNPVVIKLDYHQLTDSEFLIAASIDLGALLLEGLCDGVWVDPPGEFALELIFSLLQATRTRITKTDFISCPSCGRTLFDLQETSAYIRARTAHLKGLKIAIMGCIVNGPGEMADADYGYVGSGRGRISLYRGKTIVKKNIKTEGAVDELVELIRQDGNWKEPENNFVNSDNRGAV